MSLYSEEQIRQAKSVDLLSYLQKTDSSQLVRVSGNTFCLREHDSFRISNGKWYWFSRGMGGVSAVDFLVSLPYVDNDRIGGLGICGSGSYMSVAGVMG